MPHLLDPRRLALQGVTVTFVAWHWIEPVAKEFGRLGYNGMPPVPAAMACQHMAGLPCVEQLSD